MVKIVCLWPNQNTKPDAKPEAFMQNRQYIGRYGRDKIRYGRDMHIVNYQQQMVQQSETPEIQEHCTWVKENYYEAKV